MYRLMIVDDEPEVVNWIYGIFDEQRQLELEIFRAYSSREAVALLEKVKMDIVLSDIKMPGISGIELMEHIKLNWPRCRIIFLTGFSEFDYVYTAIQNKGVRYLLKSEEDDKIVEAVTETIADIEASLMDEEVLSKSREQMIKLIPLQQKEFLQDIVDGFFPSEDLNQEKFDSLGIQLDISKQIIIFIGRLDSLPAKGDITNHGNIFYSLKSLLEQYIPSTFSGISFVDNQRDLICFLQLKDDMICDSRIAGKDNMYDKAFHQLKGALEDIQVVIKKNLNTTISFTVYYEKFEFYKVSEKCHILKQLQGYRTGIEKEMIIVYNNDASLNSVETFSTDSVFMESYRQLRRVRLLEDYLETGQKENFYELLTRIIECLRRINVLSFSPAIEIYYSVSMMFLGHINRRNLTDKIGSEIDLHKLTCADRHMSWNEAVDYLYRIANTIFDIHLNEENERASDVVTRLKLFMNAHLNEDLSLTRLADIVCLNPTYLSRLYKQVTSRNLSEYIFEIRIEKAKNLLSQTSKKISEISVELGYESPHSFARFFKNATKATPQEYRNAFLKQ